MNKEGSEKDWGNRSEQRRHQTCQGIVAEWGEGTNKVEGTVKTFLTCFQIPELIWLPKLMAALPPNRINGLYIYRVIGISLCDHLYI